MNLPSSTRELIDIIQREGLYTQSEADDLKRIWEDLKKLQNENIQAWDMQVKAQLGKIYGPRADALLNLLWNRTKQVKQMREEIKKRPTQLTNAPGVESAAQSHPGSSGQQAQQPVPRNPLIGSQQNISAVNPRHSHSVQPVQHPRQHSGQQFVSQPHPLHSVDPNPGHGQVVGQGPGHGHPPQTHQYSQNVTHQSTSHMQSQGQYSADNRDLGQAKNRSHQKKSKENESKNQPTDPSLAITDSEVTESMVALMKELDNETEKVVADDIRVLSDVLSLTATNELLEEKTAYEDMLQDKIAASLVEADNVSEIPLWLQAAVGRHPLMGATSIASLLHHMKVGTKSNKQHKPSLFNVIPKWPRQFYPNPSPFIPRSIALPMIIPLATQSQSNPTRTVRKINIVASNLLSAGIQWHIKNIMDSCLLNATSKSVERSCGRVDDLVQSRQSQYPGGRLTLKLAGLRQGPDVRNKLLSEIAGDRLYLESVMGGEASIAEDSEGTKKRSRDEEDREENGQSKKRIREDVGRAMSQAASQDNATEIATREVVVIDKMDVLRSLEDTSRLLGLGLRSTEACRLYSR